MSGRFVLIASLLAPLVSACAWQPYVITRAIRHETGARTRFHLIVPIASTLKSYRVVEFRNLENLLPGAVPPDMERYLDDRIVRELGTMPTAPTIVRAPSDEGQPTLVIDGFLDDYDTGSLPLRIVELGFNHIAVTVRVQLHDKQTGRMLGAASITGEDDRETGSTRAAINHVAQRIRTFVNTGYAQ